MAAKHGNLSINSENIFPIIKKWLYSDNDIFVRELVSNGCDAITKLKKLEVLEKITKAMDIPIEAITELNEGALINIYSGTWQDNATAAGSIQNQTFNPIDKIVELYERLLKAEQEKVAMLHEIIKDK